MGYTHYWERNPEAEASDAYGRLALDIQKIVKAAEAAGIALGDGFGENQPVFNEGHISFNGYGNESHETFFWPAVAENPEWRAEEPLVFNFCKTAMKPYDAVVTASLIRAKDVYGDSILVHSDGDWDDWQEGRRLYEAVFGAEAVKP